VVGRRPLKSRTLAEDGLRNRAREKERSGDSEQREGVRAGSRVALTGAALSEMCEFDCTFIYVCACFGSDEHTHDSECMQRSTPDD